MECPGQGRRHVVDGAGRIVSPEYHGACTDHQRLHSEFGTTPDAVATAARDSFRDTDDRAPAPPAGLRPHRWRHRDRP
ncbi:hypothetical protein [Streptomyces sp. NPDC057616]|uniref:hypothetical protein n=1 Tax=Streptomyces sp. NPDC057616 TaxID=3346183 RepID=UPI00368468F4